MTKLANTCHNLSSTDVFTYVKSRMAALVDGAQQSMEPFGPAGAPDTILRDSEFEYLFLEHYERVLGILVRLTRSRAQAEELANEVFWRLSRQPQSWLLNSNVASWLYRTATNAGLDALRSGSRRAQYERAASEDGAHQTIPEAGPLDHLLREESRRRVQRVLARMKPGRAQILVMRSCGASYKELAELLGVSASGIGTLLNRAENEFRKKYLGMTAKEGRR